MPTFLYKAKTNSVKRNLQIYQNVTYRTIPYPYIFWNSCPKLSSARKDEYFVLLLIKLRRNHCAFCASTQSAWTKNDLLHDYMCLTVGLNEIRVSIWLSFFKVFFLSTFLSNDGYLWTSGRSTASWNHSQWYEPVH